MITSVDIQNFKSVESLHLDLGRFNVIIGANGSGKSNILEAIAMASAAQANKLDNEFLASRGIRTPDNPKFMTSAFDKTVSNNPIIVGFSSGIRGSNDFYCQIFAKGTPFYTQWESFVGQSAPKAKDWAHLEVRAVPTEVTADGADIATMPAYLNLHQFVIYSPEISALQRFERDGQIQPLGIRGEGLLKLLTFLQSEPQLRTRFNDVKSALTFLGWFDDFRIPNGSFSTEARVEVKDHYIDPELQYFDQKSTNEGFLFLLFYFSLFVADNTPKFFAIDNVDASLNPKLCSVVTQKLAEFAKKYDKQVLLTTHQPAILDGLDLTDEDQRLFVVYRNVEGRTKAKRVQPKHVMRGTNAVPLSEAFLRGYIGGLPDNF